MKVKLLGATIMLVLLVGLALTRLHTFDIASKKQAEQQYQTRLAQTQQAEAPSEPHYPIDKTVRVDKINWVTIYIKSWEHYSGDIAEDNVTLEMKLDNQNPNERDYYVPSRDSGRNRKLSLRDSSYISIRVAADSPADTGTYSYELTRK